MQTTVYVDVLLVLNYIITALLVVCMTKLLGIPTKRRKIVAAALVGSVSSLTIFLPFLGFFESIAAKVLISGAIVVLALPRCGWREFLKGWFVFFAVNFFFAGVMLGLWMAFTPRGMVYYNGVVYFDVSALTLLVATCAAYLLLALAGRVSRGGRLAGSECTVTVRFRRKECTLRALVDSGNSLCEPFSGIPVMVCSLETVAPLLGKELCAAVRAGDWERGFYEAGVSLRLVPYASVGGRGTLPAFRPDELVCEQKGRRTHCGRVYVALSAERIGDGRYHAILNPDTMGFIAKEQKVGHKDVHLQ